MTDLNCVDMSRWGGELSNAEANCKRQAGMGIADVIVQVMA